MKIRNHVNHLETSSRLLRYDLPFGWPYGISPLVLLSEIETDSFIMPAPSPKINGNEGCFLEPDGRRHVMSAAMKIR